MSAPTLPLDSSALITKDDSTPAVVFEDVALAFAENDVLRGVSFSLARGETKALFGVAGSGKRLSLKLVLGLMRPESGRLIVPGPGMTPIPEERMFCLRRESWVGGHQIVLIGSLA